jgi:hypothetical protein
MVDLEWRVGQAWPQDDVALKKECRKYDDAGGGLQGC